MPDEADGAQALHVAPPLGRKWMIPGGVEDDGGITLFVVTSDVSGITTRYEVSIPIAAGGVGELKVGTPSVVKTDD